MPPPLIAAILAGTFLLLFALERLRPLRAAARPLIPRLAVNLCMSGLAIATAAVTVRPASAFALGWVSRGSIGALPFLHSPPAPRFILTFLLFDLSFYGWHVANHRVPFLWRFHNVHHLDPDLDVSTGFRFHPGEVILSTVFRVAQVAAIGASAWAFAMYEIVFQAETLFHHSNLRLPIAVERLLNKILVTPRMHGIHHSQVRPETNSNYSVIFSWWDRLFASLRLNVPQAKVAIGVPAYSRAEDDQLGSALAAPFRRQRDYSRGPDGASPARDSACLGARRTRLEE